MASSRTGHHRWLARNLREPKRQTACEVGSCCWRIAKLFILFLLHSKLCSCGAKRCEKLILQRSGRKCPIRHWSRWYLTSQTCVLDPWKQKVSIFGQCPLQDRSSRTGSTGTAHLSNGIPASGIPGWCGGLEFRRAKTWHSAEQTWCDLVGSKHLNSGVSFFQTWLHEGTPESYWLSGALFWKDSNDDVRKLQEHNKHRPNSTPHRIEVSLADKPVCRKVNASLCKNVGSLNYRKAGKKQIVHGCVMGTRFAALNT